MIGNVRSMPMSSFKDFYDILKDLISLAKKTKNQEVVLMALDLQEKFFELREDNDSLNEEIKTLKNKIQLIEQASVLERDIEYSYKGFFTLKTDSLKIPYCSLCFKKDHRLIPLSQRNAWFQYTCGNCKTDCIVMTSNEKGINEK